MSDQGKSIPFDLTRYTETLRRELYDAAVQHLWTREDSGDYIPPYSPEDAQLTVSYLAGRWFLTYIDLDEPEDAPADRRNVVSRILADTSKRFGIHLSEV